MTTAKKEFVQLGVLMTKHQMKKIDSAAKKLGLSRSAYVRWVLLNHNHDWRING